MFVPQEGHLPSAPLKQLLAYPLLYPDQSGPISLETLQSLLTSVSLESLFKIPDLERLTDWSFLSPGQRQKLIMARVLYHAPKLAVLDEITRYPFPPLFLLLVLLTLVSSLFLSPSQLLTPSSQVDEETEARFYECCRAKNIQYLSIGHRQSLLKQHEAVLVLKDKRFLPSSSSPSALSLPDTLI